MALLARVSRLFRADIHEVLDRLEEPGVLLRQAVRDMEEDLETDERHHGKLARERLHIQGRIKPLEQSISDIDEELDLCFDSGKEELARPLVKRKLEIQHFVELLERKREELARDQAALEVRIRENRAALENMRQKAEVLTQEPDDHNGDGSRGTRICEPRYSVSDEDVDLALLREKRRRAQS